MPPKEKSWARVLVSSENLFTFPTFVGLGVFAYWVWRDGFSWGAVVGGLAIGVALFATLAVVRRFANR